MDRYTRWFLIMGTFYFTLAAGLGFVHSFGTSLTTYALRYIHVHLGLLGFMAMFIYGVGYHVIPRFNASELPFPRLVPWHFYLSNIGLLGMCASVIAGSPFGTEGPGILFKIFGGLEFATVLMFSWNTVPLLLFVKEQAPFKQEEVSVVISGESSVGETVERYPAIRKYFEAKGWKKVLKHEQSKSVVSMTFSQFSSLQQVELNDLLEKLNRIVGDQMPAPQVKEFKRGELATEETPIGELLRIYPELKPIIQQRYGDGCFSCPGHEVESVAQTAAMHGLPTHEILNELNDKIKQLKG